MKKRAPRTAHIWASTVWRRDPRCDRCRGFDRRSGGTRGRHCSVRRIGPGDRDSSNFDARYRRANG
jgi:hypothetical protein